MKPMRIESETFTPDRAKEILETSNPHNRPKNKERIRQLAEEMKAGLFVTTPEPLAFDRDGFLRNGQHRLEAVVKSNQPVELLVAYDVPEEAIRKMDRGLPWTAAHGLAAEGVRYATRLAAAARNILSVMGKRPTNSQVEEFAREHQEVLLRYVKVADQYTAGAHAAFAYAELLGWKGVEEAADRLLTMKWSKPDGDPMMALAKALRGVKGTEGAKASEVRFYTTLNALKAVDQGDDMDQARTFTGPPAKLRNSFRPEAIAQA